MTQPDVSDFKAPAAPADGVIAAGLRWQTDLHAAMANNGDAKLISVNDAVAQAGPADTSDAAAAQQNPVKTLLAIDPKELSPNLRTLQGLAGHFDKADDKGKALAEIKADVEKSISTADANRLAVETQAKADAVTLKPKYEAAHVGMQKAQGAVQAAMAKVPEADQKHVAAELNLLADDKTSPGVRKAIEADIASHPGLLAAARGFVTAEHAAIPVMKQVKALNDKVQAAEEDPQAARMVYEDMLLQTGDKAGAQQVAAEGMAVSMGMSIEAFHKLQEQKKQQDLQKGAPAGATGGAAADTPADKPAKPDDK